VVELVRAECTRVARELAKAANVGAVVYDIRPRLGLGAVGKCFDDTLEGAVESFCEVEGLVQEAVGQLAVV
jgi:cobalamin biosynthesis protein CbiG